MPHNSGNDAPLPYSSAEDDGWYRCPVCTFEAWMGAPMQDGKPVGETRFAVTHSGCGVVFPLRTPLVLADEPKPKRKRWFRRGA